MSRLRIVCEVKLIGIHSEGKVTYIDNKFADAVGEFKYHVANGYAERKVGRANVRLHNDIMQLAGIPKPEWADSVDHIDRNKLNNCLYNLRWATQETQNINRGEFRSNTTGQKNIVWRASSKKWRVVIGRNKKQHSVGYYNTIEEAVAARDAWIAGNDALPLPSE